MRLVLSSISSSYYRNKSWTQTQSHISQFAWRSSTAKNYNAPTRRWIQFCREEKKDMFDLNTNSCLKFINYCLYQLKVPITVLKSVKTFLSVCRCLAGCPFNEHEADVMHRYLEGMHNKHPMCKVSYPVTWDVTIIFRYFKSLPPNNMITQQALGGKLTLLLLLSAIARISDITRIRLSCIKIPLSCDTFILHISELTKTYTFSTMDQQGLQKYTLRKVPGFPHICPVNCLII